MKNILLSLFRPALLALGCALLATGLTAAPAADAKAPSLPLMVTFEKGAPGENGGRYSANLINASKAALKVKAVILQSVASHNRPRTIELPAHAIEPTGTWKISDLAVEDKVTLTAEGFEPMVVTVPPGK